MAAVVVVAGVELLASAVYSGLYQGGTIYTGLELGERPNLVPQVLRYPDLSEADFLRPTPSRRHHPGPARPIPDVRASGRELRQGIPVRAATAGLAGARDGARDAVRHPRRAGLQPGAAPALLDLHPRHELEPRLLQRVGDRAPDAAERSADGRPVPRRPDRGRAGARGQGRRERRRLRPGAGLRMGAARLRRCGVDGRSADRGRAARRADAEVRPVTGRLPRARAGIPATPNAAPGSAGYREVSPEDVRIAVDATTSSLVVVRNSYDPGWSATVDGRPAPLLATDYLAQGVPVSAGRHEMRLTYRDADVSRGLAAGALVWVMLLAAIPTGLVLERRRSRQDVPNRGVAGQ